VKNLGVPGNFAWQNGGGGRGPDVGRDATGGKKQYLSNTSDSVRGVKARVGREGVKTERVVEGSIP